MNKTSVHILITTGLFLGLITIFSAMSFWLFLNYSEPTTPVEVVPAVNEMRTRAMPELTDIMPTRMVASEDPVSNLLSDTNKEMERSFLLFLLITIFLSIIFSIVMSKLAERPLKEALARQRKFIADASHELKTPLSLISSEVQLFQERYQTAVPTSENINTFTNNVLTDIKRLTDITNDLLQLAKFDSGVDEIAGEIISLSRITTYLDSLQGKMKLRYPTHRLKFSNEITRAINIHGSPQDLMQVVEILVENACLHTPDNTEVELVQTLEGEQYQLRISDNGPGIAKEHIGQLFVRFFQVPGARGKIGTGLGLPIAKELIERWQGLVLVDSEVGVGTTMTVMLPVIELS